MFSVFNQHCTYFYILFHPHIFPKNTNNVTRIMLPNGPLITAIYVVSKKDWLTIGVDKNFKQKIIVKI